MPSLFTRLPSCSNLVKFSLNLRWKSVARLTYKTWSDVSSDSSSYTSDSELRHQLEKLGNKFKVNETLDQCTRERSSPLLFVRHLKESGFKHDVETYMTMVQLLCDSGMDVRLNTLFMYVIDNINKERVGFEISDLLEALIDENLIKAVDVLIEVYASVGRFEEAMHTLSKMKSKSGLMVSTRTCNFVMNELIEWKKVDMVDSVYKQLMSNGLIPDVDTYEILIKEHCRMGRLEEVWDVFVEMIEDGVEPNVFIYGRYIHALCSLGKTDLAYQVVKILRGWDKPIDVFAYTCVIRGFLKESKLQDAEDVLLHDMEIREVGPDVDCYGALILEYRKKKDTTKELDLCKEMEFRGINSDYVIVRSLMHSLCDLGRFDEALDLFKEAMETFLIDVVMCDLAIDAACKLGKMEDAMELVEWMKKGGKMNLREMHYRTLIDGYCLRREPWNALRMFEEMMRDGLKPDSTTYHLLARGFEGCGVSLPLYMLFKDVK